MARLKLSARIELVRGRLEARNANRAWSERTGLRLALTDGQTTGEGEASPLPGYSPDTLEGARKQLAALDGLEVDPLEPFEALPPLSASAAFAAEVALLDWQGKRAGWPLTALAGGARHERMEVAALVDGVESGRARLAEGYRTLKLKLGIDLDRELAVARSLRAEGATLRFDANGSLDPSALPAVLDALAALDAELLEEPCAGPWPTDTPVPLAVDESLFRDRAGALARLRDGEARWAVLKPTCLGGLRAIETLSETIHDTGAELLFSHTFGGPIERAATGAFALVFDDGAPGLAPHAGLDVWPAATLPAFEGSALRRCSAPGLGVRWEPK